MHIFNKVFYIAQLMEASYIDARNTVCVKKVHRQVLEVGKVGNELIDQELFKPLKMGKIFWKNESFTDKNKNSLIFKCHNFLTLYVFIGKSLV